MQAIETATITPAKVMELDARYGSVEARKKADIIIIDSDPLQNIRNIRKVNTVIKDEIFMILLRCIRWLDFNK